MRVGITGHSNLDETTTGLVRRALREYLMTPLASSSDLVGITCLARGADQIFADTVLALGGTIEVISPAADYFDKITDPEARRRCDRYLAQAATVTTMPYQHAGHDAYTAASQALVDTTERLIAVWDGSPDSGTGEAVTYARTQKRQVTVLWPQGARRP
jgi:predicted Rossmann fold nucleotide-binding protein DprA/Smf involved in DNA uptake